MEDMYVKLARESIISFIRSGIRMEVPDGLPSEMTDRKQGVFVSLHKYGALRGCIGTISPICDSVAGEIIENAISASTRDPRFPEVTSEEIDSLEINVDVLEPAEKINSEAELDVKKYGVIVTKGWQKGLLLPDIEGVDTVEYQISIAKQKAGIDPEDNDVKLERFEVVRHV